MSIPLLEFAGQLSARLAPTVPFGGLPPSDQEAVKATIDAFRLASSEHRQQATRMVTEPARAVLLEYARDAAMRAVRERAPGRLADGLCALAVEGGKQDPRDTIVVMTVLHRSSEILGVDSAELFEQSSNLFSDDQLRTAVRTFPARREQDRSPVGFRIVEKMTPDGFAYEQQRWDFGPQVKRAKLAEFVRRLRAKFSW